MKHLSNVLLTILGLWLMAADNKRHNSTAKNAAIRR